MASSDSKDVKDYQILHPRDDGYEHDADVQDDQTHEAGYGLSHTNEISLEVFSGGNAATGSREVAEGSALVECSERGLKSQDTKQALNPVISPKVFLDTTPGRTCFAG